MLWTAVVGIVNIYELFISIENIFSTFKNKIEMELSLSNQVPEAGIGLQPLIIIIYYY